MLLLAGGAHGDIWDTVPTRTGTGGVHLTARIPTGPRLKCREIRAVASLRCMPQGRLLHWAKSPWAGKKRYTILQATGPLSRRMVRPAFSSPWCWCKATIARGLGSINHLSSGQLCKHQHQPWAMSSAELISWNKCSNNYGLPRLINSCVVSTSSWHWEIQASLSYYTLNYGTISSHPAPCL